MDDASRHPELHHLAKYASLATVTHSVVVVGEGDGRVDRAKQVLKHVVRPSRTCLMATVVMVENYSCHARARSSAEASCCATAACGDAAVPAAYAPTQAATHARSVELGGTSLPSQQCVSKGLRCSPRRGVVTLERVDHLKGLSKEIAQCGGGVAGNRQAAALLGTPLAERRENSVATRSHGLPQALRIHGLVDRRRQEVEHRSVVPDIDWAVEASLAHIGAHAANVLRIGAEEPYQLIERCRRQIDGIKRLIAAPHQIEY